jgi:hypothetical protein
MFREKRVSRSPAAKKNFIPKILLAESAARRGAPMRNSQVTCDGFG